MISATDAPDSLYWVEVGGDGRIPPYAMHRKVNRNDVEVVSSISEEKSPRRWVLVKDGKHEAWVQVAHKDTYGYGLQPEERVSVAELEAITLKQDAIRDGTTVSIEEAKTLAESGEPEQVPHALIALYYAAKADPDVPETDVDSLREIVHEHTGHVDTSHIPTLKGILEDTLGNDSENTA